MGSSSVSCALTGVTLANCAAVLIPLAPARWPGGHGSRDRPSPIGGARIISNEGAGALFGPLTLPIIGNVGDYGDLESYREDANVRFLKARFGDEFDNFISGCTYGGQTKLTNQIARKVAKTRYDKKRPGWDGNLSGCWIAKSAWDRFSTLAWNENGTLRSSVAEDGWLDPQNLKGMGFKRGKQDAEAAQAILGTGPHEGGRYHTPYTHQGLPELIVWCDEHMSSRASYKGAMLDIGLKFDAFLKALEKLKLSPPKSLLRWSQRTSIYRGHLVMARKQMVESAASDKRHEEFVTKNPQCNWHLIKEGSDENTQVFCTRRSYMDEGGSHRHIIIERDGSHSVTGCPSRENHTDDFASARFKFTPEVFETIKALKMMGWRQPKRPPSRMGSSDPYLRGFPEETLHIYGDEFLSNKFIRLTEKLLCFEGNMYAANRMLAPTMSGWQCGNNATQREVAKMALKLVAARDRRYK